MEHYETATLPALVLPALPSLPNTERERHTTALTQAEKKIKM